MSRNLLGISSLGAILATSLSSAYPMFDGYPRFEDSELGRQLHGGRAIRLGKHKPRPPQGKVNKRPKNKAARKARAITRRDK